MLAIFAALVTDVAASGLVVYQVVALGVVLVVLESKRRKRARGEQREGL